MFKQLANIIIILIELALIQIVRCGFIQVQDYELDYTNKNDVSQMKFIFSLQSGLGANNFFRLSFPAQIYSTSISKVVVTYSYQGQNGCSTMQQLPAKIALDAPSTKDYLISFYNDINQPTDLLASPHWYALYIQPEKGVIFPLGIQKPIIAQTQSLDIIPPGFGNAIIYDYTNSFAVLEFDDNPYTTLDSSIQISSLYTQAKTMLGAKYEISFVVKPQASIANGARIVIMINEDPKFKFVGLCVSEENSDASGTTPPLDSSQYKCSVDKTTNRVIILIYNGILTGEIYRFRASVQNPNYVSSLQADIEVRTMLSNSNKIIEKKIISDVLSTAPLTATQKVIMGNGINLSDVTYPKRASIISGQNFYNPFQFQFQTSMQTPDKVKLRVSFKIKIDMTNDQILTGSIMHNFPRFDINIPVKCILGTVPTSNYYIQCDEVGPLSSSNSYYVTSRIYFNAAGTLDNNFGSVSVSTIDEDTGLPSSLIPEVSQAFASKVITSNLVVVDTASNQYGYQLVHSQISSDSTGSLSLSPILSTNSGIKVCQDTSQKQKIVVTLYKGLIGSFGAGVADYALRLTTTPNIKAAPGSSGGMFTVESLNGACSISTDFPTDNRKMITTTTDHTDILLVAATGVSCMSQAASTTTFSIGDVQILSHGSSYAGRDAFDFYGALYSTYVDGTTTPTSYFAVNANTISMKGSSCTSTQLNYINIALSNYQTSSGGQTQISDGTKYPAFIRITGYLMDDEKQYAKRIAVFFNNVDFYSINKDNYGQTKVSCSSSMNPNQQCWGYSGQINESQSMHSMKRVEFDVSAFIGQTGSSSPFQLLIPIKAIGSAPLQRIFVAVLTSNPNYGQLTQAFIVSNTMSSYTIVTGSIAAMHPTPSDLSYNIIVSTRTQGSQEDAQVSIGHNGSVQNILQNNPNIDTTQLGAAFVITGNWKMYSDTLTIATNSVVNTNVMSERCLAFKYLSSGLQKYGIYCPFTFKNSVTTISSSTAITFNNFVFPALGPLKLSGTFITWSQNSGSLISALEDSYLASETILPNKISNVHSIILRRYFSDNRVEFLFTTKNPFPKNGKINIKLNDSGNPWSFTVFPTALCRCILYQQTGSFIETACSVAVQTIINLEFTFSATKDFPAANYKLVMYGIQTPTTSISKTYSIIISTNSAAGVIDISDSSSTLTFDNNPTWNTDVDQIAASYSHDKITNSIGNMDMTFRISKRPILALSTPNPGPGNIPGQYLEVKITKLVGQEANMKCFVLKDSKPYFGFKSIDSSNAAAIMLYPRDDILEEDCVFQLRCLNIQNIYSATTVTYQVRLLYNDGAVKQVIIGSISSPTDPAFTTPVAFTNFNLDKYNGLAGSKYHLQFQLTLSANGITKQSALYLQFPPKYDHIVGTQVLHCRVNSKVVYCINLYERCIQISAFPVDIAANTLFQLEVYGVIEPLSGSGTGNILVSFGTTRDPNDIKEQVVVPDPATIADTTLSLIVLSSVQDNLYSREGSSYKLNIIAPSVISSTEFIYIEYPQEFGTSLTVSPPTDCQISSLDDSQIYGQNCDIFGTNIMLLVDTNIPVGEFKITISKIINPEDTMCSITKIMLSILSPGRQTVIAKSTVSSSNQLQSRSTYSDDLNYLNWFLGESEIIYNFQTIKIKAGTYSQLITLKDIDGPIRGLITFDLLPLTSAEFSLISDKKIYPGQNEEFLRIGCPISSIPGMFTLIFTKKETVPTPIYGNLGLLNILVSDDQHIIQPEQLGYLIFGGGYSLPIKFDLSDMLPYENVSILFEIIPGPTDPKIDLVDENNSPVPQYTLNFSPKQPKGKIYVRSAIYIHPVTPNHYSKLKMTIFGSDANSYKATTDDIMLQLISDSPIPDLSYSQIIDQVSPSATKQNLRATANLPCQIFYHLRLSNGPSRSLNEVKQLVDQYINLNPLDYYQEQFGSFNYQSLDFEQAYQIYNLRSKLNYIISTWAVDTLQRVSQQFNFVFTTKNNNGRVMMIPIEFQKPITIAQKELIACFMCTIFAIPCLNVMSYDSIYCKAQSEYQLSIVDQVNTGTSRILQFDDDNSNEINDVQQRNLQSSSVTYTVNFYTISIDQYEQDISWNRITKIVDLTAFQAELAAIDSTLPVIQSIKDPTEITAQTAPVFINLPTVQSGTDWISVDKIETHINSLIWMYIVDVTSGGTPSKQQMKFKLTSKNKTSSQFIISLYDQTNVVSYNFTDLVSDKQYALYIMSTTENPSLFAPTSEVSFIGSKTKAEAKAQDTYSNCLLYISKILLLLTLLL